MGNDSRILEVDGVKYLVTPSTSTVRRPDGSIEGFVQAPILMKFGDFTVDAVESMVEQIRVLRTVLIKAATPDSDNLI